MVSLTINFCLATWSLTDDELEQRPIKSGDEMKEFMDTPKHTTCPFSDYRLCKKWRQQSKRQKGCGYKDIRYCNGK